MNSFSTWLTASCWPSSPCMVGVATAVSRPTPASCRSSSAFRASGSACCSSSLDRRNAEAGARLSLHAEPLPALRAPCAAGSGEPGDEGIRPDTVRREIADVGLFPRLYRRRPALRLPDLGSGYADLVPALRRPAPAGGRRSRLAWARPRHLPRVRGRFCTSGFIPALSTPIMLKALGCVDVGVGDRIRAERSGTTGAKPQTWEEP